MPKYSVRFYSEYCDEYEVEAASAEEAQELAAQFEYVCDLNSAARPEQLARQAALAEKVEVVERHAYVDGSGTYINELAADGSYLEA